MVVEDVLDGHVAGHEAVHEDAAAHREPRKRQEHGDVTRPCERFAEIAFTLAHKRARDEAHGGHGDAGEGDEQSDQSEC